MTIIRIKQKTASQKRTLREFSSFCQKKGREMKFILLFDQMAIYIVFLFVCFCYELEIESQ